MPFKTFQSERLKIVRLITESSEILSGIMDVLSGNATEHLPEDWRNIDSPGKAGVWLRQRISESEIFSVSTKDGKEVVGLLIVYGYDQGREDQSIRIGYVISEKFWGNGLASELIGALASKLSRVGNISSVIGGVVPSNIGSVKVLSKNGFHLLESINGTEFYQRKF